MVVGWSPALWSRSISVNLLSRSSFLNPTDGLEALRLVFSRIASALSTIVVLATGLAGAAAAQSDVKMIKREEIKNWNYLCFENAAAKSDAERSFCRINSQVWSKGDQPKLIMAVVIQLASTKRIPVMVLRLPPAAVPDQKIRMQVDDKPALVSPPLKCFEQECRTEMSMSESQIAEMMAGGTFRITFKGPQDKSFRTNVSLSGFTRAFKTLTSGST
jgi:invasion protein IalB